LNAGEVWCWGSNESGQVGTGSTAEAVSTPMRVGKASDWTALDAAYVSTCAIRAGELYCWGHNDSGQLGTGSTDLLLRSPARVGSETDWTAVSTGAHTCGLRSDGLYCWGLAGVGAGDGSMHTTPVPITNFPNPI